MPTSARKRVLISEPQAFVESPYLPYMWAVLKSYCDRIDALGQVEWLEPIYVRGNAGRCVAPYRDRMPDVLGLSCYTWNWDLQCEIARCVKSQRPGCLVVAGGPHPDYKDPGFFRAFPFIDVVAVKDGEIPFSRILAKVGAGDEDFDDVAGLYLPEPGRAGARFTGPAEVPTSFVHSPYIEQSDYFDALGRTLGRGRFDVIWETNRGCPYSCNFCDWGSNTMSQVRRFDMERVSAEVAWFAKMGVKGVLLTDANFGIFPRDLEIADLLNAARARYGHPRFVHYSPAKNNPERSVEIARKFAGSGISPVHTFAVQHTDEEVLASADRSNISVAKQRAVAKAMSAEEIPTVVQLILGLPGDTYERWKTCLTDLMDWGLHDNYQVFNYALLPNAPAADPGFAARWEIGTIVRDVPQEGTGQRKTDGADALTRVTIIVSSKSFSSQDWVRMKVFTALVRALHNFGVTRLIAMYLRFGHGVTYLEFYDQLIESYFGQTDLYRALAGHFDAFLADEGAFEDLAFERFQESSYLEASRWAFVQICLECDRYFEEMRAFLLSRFPAATNLASAIDYQRNVIVLPSGRGSDGQAFRTDFDWVGYFDRARRLSSHEPLGEPDPVPGAVVMVEDQGFGAEPQDEREAWRTWMERTQQVRRTLSSSLQRLRLQRGGEPVGRRGPSAAPGS